MGYRGQRKHLKRTNAPKSYHLHKMGGAFALKPICGPHSAKSSIPLAYLLRYNLKYAESNEEVRRIMKKRCIRINGQVRSIEKYPVGLFDILSINKKHFYQLVYNANGCFTLVKLDAQNPQHTNTRLCKVLSRKVNHDNIPSIQTHDGTHLRFIHPMIRVNDTIRYDFVQKKIVEILPQKIGQTVMAIDGNNSGRIGVLTNIDKALNRNHSVTVKDARDKTFVTRLENIMVIGDSSGPSCPMLNEGIRYTHAETCLKKLVSGEQSIEDFEYQN
ncbi:MAG: 40S ribosomal protein S4 [Marteilia pararefringens]